MQEQELRPREVPAELRRRVRTLERDAVNDLPWLTVRDVIADLGIPTDAENGLFDTHVLRRGARAYPGHSGSVWDWPGKTLKAGVHGVPGGENMLARVDG